MNKRIISNKTRYVLFILFISILPLQHMVFSVMLGNIGLLKYLKDIILVILIMDMIFFVISNKKLKINLVDLSSIFFMIFLILYTIFSTNKIASIYMIRIYSFPIFFYYVLKYSNFNIVQFRKCISYLLNYTCILSLFGIYQALILGDKFLINLGYGDRLPYAFYISGLLNFQRVASTFASPNNFAFFIGIVIFISISNINILKPINKFVYIKIFIVVLALVLTFSRTAWIALLFTISIYYYKNINFSKLVKVLIGIAIGTGIMYIIDLLVLNGVMFRNVEHLITRTASMEDTSIIGHIDSLYESFYIASKNLLGTGFGINGPKASQFTSNPYLVESSYFLIMYEVGIFGAIVYFSIYVFQYMYLNIREINKFPLDINLFRQGKCIITYILIMYLTLPNVQETEPVLYIFMLIGIIESLYIKHKDNLKDSLLSNNLDI